MTITGVAHRHFHAAPKICLPALTPDPTIRRAPARGAPILYHHTYGYIIYTIYVLYLLYICANIVPPSAYTQLTQCTQNIYNYMNNKTSITVKLYGNSCTFCEHSICTSNPYCTTCDDHQYLHIHKTTKTAPCLKFNNFPPPQCEI